jgi:hypothetical protein
MGEELRIRIEVRVDQPLLGGVNLQESNEYEVGKWFDLKYEKVSDDTKQVCQFVGTPSAEYCSKRIFLTRMTWV